MPEQKQTYHLKLTNKVSELERIHSAIEMLSKEWDISTQSGNQINLAIEEAFINVINYAYEDQNRHDIEVVFARYPEKIEIALIDDGRAYNPTQNEDPDTSLSIQDRPIGGLGIFLIKKLMDRVEYQRKEDKNHLILNKNL
jgi:serine/threonine-protein kinase RsbW